jgi:membrane-bound metal-dependent hydrolase YbcI (DUF457 family)
MDTITHGIVGALVGKALFAGRYLPVGSAQGARLRYSGGLQVEPAPSESAPMARAAITACTLGAMFPDIDVFAGPIARNPLAIMEWHRNITHSLVMLPVWALLLAAVSLPLARWVGWEPPSFARLVGIYAFGLGTHVLLDVATNFGTMVWSPLNYSRMAWDWLFILDFGFSAMALVPQLAAWCYREPAKFAWRAGVVWVALTAAAFGVYALANVTGYGFPTWVVGGTSGLMAAVLFVPALKGIGFRWRTASWCRAGMAALCIYLAFAAAAHRQALRYAADFAASRHLRVDYLAALPLPPTLTHWAGVIITPEGVWRTTFRVPDGNLERTQLYADVASDRYVAKAEQLRDVQVYLWFARFPIWQVTQREGRTTAAVTDVRFFRGEDTEGSDETQQPRRGAGAPTRTAGFTFEVVFDAAGHVISHGFKKPE